MADFIEQNRGVLGEDGQKFTDFPLMIKLIDAKENLSVQVHPDDDFARRVEGKSGKSEMWYVLSAVPGACLYCGFKREISKEEILSRLGDGSVLEVLARKYVKKGDVFFIPPGTVHSIGGGVMVAEIQQNSNVTYRLYDYDRLDRNGGRRELHIEKGMAVLNTVPTPPPSLGGGGGVGLTRLACSSHFVVDRLHLDGKSRSFFQGQVDEKSFLSIYAIVKNRNTRNVSRYNTLSP